MESDAPVQFVEHAQTTFLVFSPRDPEGFVIFHGARQNGTTNKNRILATRWIFNANLAFLHWYGVITSLRYSWLIGQHYSITDSLSASPLKTRST